MYCLPAHMNGDAAAGYFARPRLLNAFGLLTPSVGIAMAGVPSSRKPPFVERLWMPAYAVSVGTVSSKGEQRVWTSVEGISETFSLFDCVDDLAERVVEEDAFPPAIDEAAASDVARKGLLRYILGQRGQIDKPVVQAVLETRLYHFPIWVLYFHRYKKQRIDLKVLDAYSGKSAGAKMRIAVLDALIAARKRAHR